MLFSNIIEKNMFKIVVCLMAISFAATGSLFAEPKIEKITERKKVGMERANATSVTGIISYVDKEYISVITSKDKQAGTETEIGFQIDEEEQKGWRKKLSEMKSGDNVMIVYEEIKQDYDVRYEKGHVERKTNIEKFKAKSVKFLSAAKTSLTSD